VRYRLRTLSQRIFLDFPASFMATSGSTIVRVCTAVIGVRKFSFLQEKGAFPQRKSGNADLQ
jgi:hypothetical protein